MNCSLDTVIGLTHTPGDTDVVAAGHAGEEGASVMTISDPLIQWIRVGLVFLALVAFAVLFGAAISQVWTAHHGRPPLYADPYLYVATGLAALVGGIFAVAFGAKSSSSTPSGTVMPTMVGTNLGNLGSVPALTESMQTILGAVYALVYVLVGVGALTTWVFHPNEISDLVKNLGTTFLGLALPIVAAFFRSPS